VAANSQVRRRHSIAAIITGLVQNPLSVGRHSSCPATTIAATKPLTSARSSPKSQERSGPIWVIQREAR
jgi:hypothetical protein